MESVLAGILETAKQLRAPAVPSAPAAHSALLAEMERVKARLACVSAQFDQQSDPDLLEECIYEMQALTARFRYLTREAKRAGVTRGHAAALQKL